MTTETVGEVKTQEPTAQEAWDAGLKELSPPPDPKPQDTPPAPSNEGVVVSGDKKPDTPSEAKPDEKPAVEQKRLGGLSTDELMERVRNDPTNPDTIRALEIRLKRLDSQAKPRRERNQNAQAAAQAATEVQAAIKGLGDDYPELATRLAPVSKLAEVVTRPIVDAENRAQAESDEALVESAFPGFNKVRGSGGPLDQWLKTQPHDVQDQARNGGVAGAMAVLEAYEQYEIASGRQSPFAPQQQAPAPKPAPQDDPVAQAARIKAEREQRLKAATAIAATVAKPTPTPETEDRAAWNAGVAEVLQDMRFNK